MAAEGRVLPDLEGSRIPSAALFDRRRPEPFRRACERIELSHRAGRRDRQLALADRERRPFEIGEINQPGQMRLGLREQPRPAREPSIACRPNGQLRPRLGAGDFPDCGQIPGYASAFKEMQLPLRIPARPAPTLAWIGLVLELQGWRSCSVLQFRSPGESNIIDRNRAIWIKDPLAILADGAERGVVVQNGRIVELVPKGGQPKTSAAFFEAGDPVGLAGVINTHHHFYHTFTPALPAAPDRRI